MSLNFRIEPEGFSFLCSKEEYDSLSEKDKKLADAFLADRYQALLDLALDRKILDADFTMSYLQKIAETFVTDLLRCIGLEEEREFIEVKPSQERIEDLLDSMPLLHESSLITQTWIEELYASLLKAYAKEIAAFEGSVKKFFNEHNPDLNPPETVFFHLVENRKNEDYPFAFLATYASRGKDGRIVHHPLSTALEEFKGDRKQIVELLSCLNQAADICSLISSWMINGELFHPIGLSAAEAYEFLKAVSDLEEKAGIVCRIPNWWRKKASSVSASLSIGDSKTDLMGLDSILSVKPVLQVDGMKLTKKEIELLLKSANSLVFIKGKWVEADPDRLKKLLEQLEQVPDSMSLLEAMRMQAGLDESGVDEEDELSIRNGKWLSSLRTKLTNPTVLRNTALPRHLQASLRPYQKDGYNWLNALSTMRFGALLADDMGLGKTLQTLAWLEKQRQNNPDAKALLFVPASLIGNWQQEAARFVPDLDLWVLHGKTTATLKRELCEKEDLPFLTITTYQTGAKLESLKERNWDYFILDEAQAIKNPKTKQSRAIKEIPSTMRLAMTGTPIENDLINLWSIFDFLNAGLLGSLSEFRKFAADKRGSADNTAKLSRMISPFMLRRLKTDTSIISDLPQKTELSDRIELSEKQKVLYMQIVNELEESLREQNAENAAASPHESKSRPTDQSGTEISIASVRSDISRKGQIFAVLSKLKQICNHPDQYLGQSGYAPKDSGKFLMLEDLCTQIRDSHECVLVFTQFREMTEVLDRELESIFHAKGRVIHGGTPVKKRQEIVDEFNRQEFYIPYVVLSLKAAGTGLNLTQASHVIHFDRWWNPAVENQATDRAYRIGQKRNVIVHKFICQNTIEEKIDEMLHQKQSLSDRVIQASSESWLMSMDDDELLDSLRIHL